MRDDEKSLFRQIIEFLGVYYGIYLGIPVAIVGFYYFANNDDLVLAFWIVFLSLMFINIVWANIKNKRNNPQDKQN